VTEKLSEGGFKCFETGFDGPIPDIGTDFDADAAKQFGVHMEFQGEMASIFLRETCLKIGLKATVERAGTFNNSPLAIEFSTDKRNKAVEDRHVSPGLGLGNFGHNGTHAYLIQLAIDEAGFEELAGGSAGFLADFHG